MLGNHAMLMQCKGATRCKHTKRTNEKNKQANSKINEQPSARCLRARYSVGVVNLIDKFTIPAKRHVRRAFSPSLILQSICKTHANEILRKHVFAKAVFLSNRCSELFVLFLFSFLLQNNFPINKARNCFVFRFVFTSNKSKIKTTISGAILSSTVLWSRLYLKTAKCVVCEKEKKFISRLNWLAKEQTQTHIKVTCNLPAIFSPFAGSLFFALRSRNANSS